MLLLFFRPEGVGLWWAILLLVLSASILVESLVFAAPVHYGMDRRGRNDEGGVSKLIRLNDVRLLVSTASSAIVIYLLAGALSA